VAPFEPIFILASLPFASASEVASSTSSSAFGRDLAGFFVVEAGVLNSLGSFGLRGVFGFVDLVAAPVAAAAGFAPLSIFLLI
jgi:hypothetical protein